ncbi:ribonuclease HI, partial [Mycolicibacterium elephantis]
HAGVADNELADALATRGLHEALALQQPVAGPPVR